MEQDFMQRNPFIDCTVQRGGPWEEETEPSKETKDAKENPDY